MNLEQVATYIREPYKLGLHQADDLKQLCEDFPYTAVYPLLYLTALSNAKSPTLEGALEKYAYRLSDRSRLFDLVSQAAEQKAATTADLKPEEIVAADSVDNASLPISETNDAVIPVAEEPIETAIRVENIHTDEVIQEDQIKAYEQPKAAAEKAVAEPFDYFTTASSVGQEYFSLENEEDVEKPAGESQIEVEERETGPRSFTDWLKSNGSKPVSTNTENDSAPSKNQLIDRFIETQPSITRQKAEFFSPPKKAKESLNEDTMPVSETLARIFTMQGNYPKAIHVYHQLMLANPEKKTFFAVQIEELKKKLTL